MLRGIAESLTLYITTAMILALLTGGFPSHSSTIATIALILAMTFSAANIPFKIEKKDTKELFFAFLLNYVVLSAIILAMGLATKKYWEGFVVMAFAPPAIAVVPLSAILGGDKKQSLFSVLFLYVAAIFLLPLMLFVILGEEVNSLMLIKNILLLIALPLLLSRLIKGRIDGWSIKMMTNICFFFIVFSIVGKNRGFLFEDATTILLISAMMMVRTIGTGGIIKKISEWKGVRKENSINYALFASFKNEGLVMILASSLFGYEAAIPAMIALIFELIFIFLMESKIL